MLNIHEGRSGVEVGMIRVCVVSGCVAKPGVVAARCVPRRRVA